MQQIQQEHPQHLHLDLARLARPAGR